MDHKPHLPTCLICFQVFKEPCIDSCGHTFCQECLASWTKASGYCPISKKSLQKKPKPNHSLKELLTKNLVDCVNERTGCSWQGTIKGLSKYHSSNCPFKDFKQDILTLIKQNDNKGLAKFSEVTRDDGSVFKGILNENGFPKFGILKFGEGKNYEGYFENEKFEGVGKLKESQDLYFEGQFKNNLKHGYGILFLKQKLVIDGQFVDNKLSGSAVLYTPEKNWKGDFYFDEALKNGRIDFTNGNKFNGQFEDCSPKRGTLQFSNGDILACDFQNLKANGKGTLQMANGNFYQGSFKDGLFQGQGELTLAKEKLKYAGQFSLNKKHGFGVLFNKDAKFMEGQFVNDEFEGPENKIFMPDGSIITVEFKKGFSSLQIVQNFPTGEIFKGKITEEKYPALPAPIKNYEQAISFFKKMTGVMTYPSGEKFEGSYVNSQRFGKGKFFYLNGDVYEGVYLNDKANGQGELKMSNGMILKGVWKNDKIEGDSTLEFKGNIIQRNIWKNGVLSSQMFVNQEKPKDKKDKSDTKNVRINSKK